MGSAIQTDIATADGRDDRGGGGMVGVVYSLAATVVASTKFACESQAVGSHKTGMDAKR